MSPGPLSSDDVLPDVAVCDVGLCVVVVSWDVVVSCDVLVDGEPPGEVMVLDGSVDVAVPGAVVATVSVVLADVVLVHGVTGETGTELGWLVVDVGGSSGTARSSMVRPVIGAGSVGISVVAPNRERSGPAASDAAPDPAPATADAGSSLASIRASPGARAAIASSTDTVPTTTTTTEPGRASVATRAPRRGPRPAGRHRATSQLDSGRAPGDRTSTEKRSSAGAGRPGAAEYGLSLREVSMSSHTAAPREFAGEHNHPASH
jgi:hypothetical protein